MGRSTHALAALAVGLGFMARGLAADRGVQPQPATLVPPESLEQGFVLVATDESGAADEQTPIFLASNHVGWNPGAPSMRLVRGSDGLWRIELPKPGSSEPLRFKFTLGDWSRVEQDEDGNDIPNRSLEPIDAGSLASGQRPLIRLSIKSFREPDAAAAILRTVDPYRTLAVTGEVRRVQVSGGAGIAAGATRDVLVWLPPEYDAPENRERRYPVLYLQDGQNIFEALPGVFGEWHADEIATDLIARGEIEPLIIVGIPHSGPGRMEEYVPIRIWDDFNPEGDAYIRWMFREVMPRVERAFRISTSPADTAIGGASLGAVISIHAHALAPDRFGGLLIESLPTLRDGHGMWRGRLAQIERWPTRVFLGVGGREVGDDPTDAPRNLEYVLWSQDVLGLIRARSNAGSGPRFVFGEADNHNEDAWARRLPDALRFMFPPRRRP